MLLRLATHNDVPAIAHVQVTTWRTTYRGMIPDDYLATLSAPKKEPIWHGMRTTRPVDFTNRSGDKKLTAK